MVNMDKESDSCIAEVSLLAATFFHGDTREPGSQRLGDQNLVPLESQVSPSEAILHE